ncbi:Dynein regulatory complex subunit 3 [Cichlidogyrus casuarinus]|uniref:Dynein regulatory complex subunit 3 n=1 Tax=Cichlidogyrus casuarinus TaxID=1844966 RepID=A0ABD2QC87_9PLAT
MDIKFQITAPTVIDDELIQRCCIKDQLDLSFKNIVVIGHLDQYSNLTKLRLDNNFIERIQRLDRLCNLRILNLSFNRIKVIDNLDHMQQLIDLNLFHNEIKSLLPLKTLKSLRFVSLGCNCLEDFQELEQFFLHSPPQLNYLTLTGNPMAKDPTYRDQVITCLSNLHYLDNRYITREEREKAVAARGMHLAIEKAIVTKKELQERDRELEQEKQFRLRLVDAGVDGFVPDKLYSDLMAKVKQIVPQVGNYHFMQENNEQLRLLCDTVSLSLSELGLELLKNWELELEQFQNAFDQALNRAQKNSVKQMKKYMKLRKKQEKLHSRQSEEIPENSITKIAFTSLFSSLMLIEDTLDESILDVFPDFEQSLKELIGHQLKVILPVIVNLRDELAKYYTILLDNLSRYYQTLTNPMDKNFIQELGLTSGERENFVNLVQDVQHFVTEVVDNMESGYRKMMQQKYDKLHDHWEKLIRRRHFDRLNEIRIYLLREQTLIPGFANIVC